MITEELKIKIINYLDGELDPNEEKEVLDILAQDRDANTFCNEMKSLDISLIDFTNSSQYLEFSRRTDDLIDNFIDSNIMPESPKSFLQLPLGDVIANLFTSKIILMNSLTACLCLTVGFYFNALINTEGPQLTLGLDDSVYSKNITITRSSADTKALQDIFRDTIAESIENNSSQAKLTIGSESYLFFIKDKFQVEENMICYSGNIYSKEKDENFNYCISKDNMLTIFTE